MATKKTTKTTEKTAAKAKPAAKAKAPAKAKAAPKAAKPPKEAGESRPALPRHPKARLAKLHTGKAELAQSLAKSLAREDEDSAQIADRLRTASNTQLLRLQHVVEIVHKKFGSRAKLIEAIGNAEKKSTDKDYLAKLDLLSLPNLLELAVSHERRARA
ncbi:MAG TPA: hypothetical protein VMJ10_36565 [Kofleriaceae bacterium]|nr:hypothetical protein [Kofleriaceae bacterium]